MEEVTGGMRLALRHWRELAGTTLIFALVCFALSFILGDVIVEVGVLRGGATEVEIGRASCRERV